VLRLLLRMTEHVSHCAQEAARNASAKTVARGDILQFADLDKRACRISELRRVRKRISVVEKSLAAQRAQGGSGGELLALMRAGRDTVPATLRLLETEVRHRHAPVSPVPDAPRCVASVLRSMVSTNASVSQARNLLTQNASCVYYYGNDGIPDEEGRSLHPTGTAARARKLFARRRAARNNCARAAPADAPPAPPASVDSRTIDDLLMRRDAGREDAVPSDVANR
jgi:hypothetical protein